jgi:hypothetical protein
MSRGFLVFKPRSGEICKADANSLIWEAGAEPGFVVDRLADEVATE